MEITIDQADLVRTVLLLDAAQEALDAAAAREKKREAGKTMRCITEQDRAKIARDHVEYMDEKYGIGI